MVDVDKAVRARLKSHGETFEILVDPMSAREKSVEEVLAAKYIYKDADAGERASEEDLKKVFGTTDIVEIAKRILDKGEIQLTTTQRHEILEEKRKRIISLISRDSVDPRTKLPHPPGRIESAMEEARVHIDINKKAEDQIDDIVKKLRPLIPLSFETRRIAVRLPAQYANAYYSFKGMGKTIKEEWQKDGSFIAAIEIPAGMQDEFYKKINSLTKGNAEIRVMK